MRAKRVRLEAFLLPDSCAVPQARQDNWGQEEPEKEGVGLADEDGVQ